MPRPRFSNWPVASSFTVAAGSTVPVSVDLIDTFYPQFMLTCNWASTSGTTGLALSISRGYVTAVNSTLSGAGLSAGTTGETITFADHPDSVTIYTQPSTYSPTQVIRPDFAVNPEIYPRYIQLNVTNQDTLFPMTCSVVGDR